MSDTNKLLFMLLMLGLASILERLVWQFLLRGRVLLTGSRV
jgi:hypothetical protein